jgi:hypothetical protein
MGMARFSVDMHSLAGFLLLPDGINITRARIHDEFISGKRPVLELIVEGDGLPECPPGNEIPVRHPSYTVVRESKTTFVGF